MKYALNLTNYGNPEVFQENRLPARSYFVPFSSCEEEARADLLHKRYQSTNVTCLNGEWDFKYYANPNDLPAEFDTDAVEFDKIPVPSCWQYIQKDAVDENGVPTGNTEYPYGKPAYINLRYPFKYRPPYVPTTEPVTKYFSLADGFIKAPEGEYNHVGVYRTYFDAKGTEDYIISFLGVCSCVDVYLNGQYIGYSEGSHNTAEFDLSGALVVGQNELLCVVHRWCTGTYLECQDMFRNNGIFRDVLLRKKTEDDIWDIDFTTKRLENGCYQAVCRVKTQTQNAITMRLSGHGIALKQSHAGDGEGLQVVFERLKVKEWNAETPYLYDLYIETKSQVIHQRVGFKTMEIKGDLFLLNGHKIKFHGVNHHDTDAKTGYYMTPENIERDIKLCKEYNIDMIRTSHYPPDPLLIELCAEYGLYVVDETDLETHGTLMQNDPPTYNAISNKAFWTNRYLDRTERLYQRDKLLSTPVVMWSLGNESGAGVCTDATYAYLKSVSPLPVQYESAIYNKKIMAYDVASQMYPQVADVEKVGKKTHRTKKFCDRPYFLCEYAHAMGVGPGNIEGYWDAFYQYDNLIGGCIWEMNDHAVLEKRDGQKVYTYGGDHDEWIHDSNFCCDGIFYPDRTPSTGAKIARHAYTPIRIKRLSLTTVEVTNTTAFTPGSAFVVKFVMMREDMHLDEVEYVPNLAPLEHKKLDLEQLFSYTHFKFAELKGNIWINAEVREAEKGRVRDTMQFVIAEKVLHDPKTPANLPKWFAVNRDSAYFGLDLRTASEATLLYRAGTDNDKTFFSADMVPWYDQKIEMISHSETEQQADFVYHIMVGKRVFEEKDTYTAFDFGDNKMAVKVATKLKLIKGSKKGYLPRYAKVLRLPEEYTQIKWLGTRDECYVDMREQTQIGIYEADIWQMKEPNIRPQESGNRMDSQWVEITGGAEKYRIEALGKPFDLEIKPYSDRRLLKMKHRADEKASGTYIALGAFQQGIGTGSCGPVTLPKHRRAVADEYELNYLVYKL